MGPGLFNFGPEMATLPCGNPGVKGKGGAPLLGRVWSVMDPFERRMLGVLEKEPCLAHTRCLMVAISGGPDSVALLAGLCRLAPQLGVEIRAAHVNHGLRPEESADHERFVTALCEELGVPLTVRRLAGMTAGGGNLEEWLRGQRYQVLEELSAAQGGVVVTAHQANDQAETLLLKLARGAGLTGLSGIHPRLRDEAGRVRVIRPLLSFRRREILDYLGRRKMSFCTDSSNLSTQLDRNWVRQELLPLMLERLNPRTVEHLSQTATLAREAQGLMTELATAALPEVIRARGREVVELDISNLSSRALALRRYLVREAVVQLSGGLTGLDFEQVESVLALCDATEGHQVALPAGLVASRQFGSLVLKVNRPVRPFRYRLSIPGELPIEALNKTISLEPWKKRFESSNAVRLAGLTGDLVVRSRVPGDVFCTRSGRRRKLKKVLHDEHIPRDLRDRLILLTTADRIVWVEKLWAHPDYREDLEPQLALWVRDETFDS